MESSESPNPLTGTVEITDDDLVKFLIFFAGLWFKTNHFWKAGRALLAAIFLRLVSFWKDGNPVLLEEKDPKLSLRDPLDLIVAARVVFAGMTYLEVHPFILKIIKEMEKEANALLTYYLLAIHPEEELCG